MGTARSSNLPVHVNPSVMFLGRRLVEKFVPNTILLHTRCADTSPSVKLKQTDKANLDKLQSPATLKSGCKITQQEILSTLIGEAMRSSDQFAERIAAQDAPIPDERYEKVLSLVEDWGVETTWKDIDRILCTRKRTR